jgi:hypothetical protein
MTQFFELVRPGLPPMLVKVVAGMVSTPRYDDIAWDDIRSRFEADGWTIRDWPGRPACNPHCECPEPAHAVEHCPWHGQMRVGACRYCGRFTSTRAAKRRPCPARCFDRRRRT